MPQSRGVCTRVRALQMMTYLEEVPWKQIYLRLLNTKFKISTEFFLSEKKKKELVSYLDGILVLRGKKPDLVSTKYCQGGLQALLACQLQKCGLNGYHQFAFCMLRVWALVPYEPLGLLSAAVINHFTRKSD